MHFRVVFLAFYWVIILISLISFYCLDIRDSIPLVKVRASVACVMCALPINICQSESVTSQYEW